MSVALGLPLVQFIYFFFKIDFSITSMYILSYRLTTELTCVSLKDKHFILALSGFLCHAINNTGGGGVSENNTFLADCCKYF